MPEEQTFRVDHFLARSTVLNLLGVRFANRIFEPIWNNEHVESVDIVFDEPLTLEGRAGYYDKAGALVDMIQSHLLQVMALVAMNPIGEVSALDLREAKAAVLRATRVWGGDAASSSRRADYTAGTIDGREVPDYVKEPGVDPARHTETLAEVTLEIDSWRWAGVPFRLRSGKSVGVARKEVVVTFKPVPHLPTGLTGACEPDRLRLVMGPDAIALDVNVNGEDDPMTIDRVSLLAQLAPAGSPRTGRCWPACSTATRCSPSAATPPSTAGGSSTPSSTRGSPARSRWRRTPPAPRARTAGPSDARFRDRRVVAAAPLELARNIF